MESETLVSDKNSSPVRIQMFCNKRSSIEEIDDELLDKK